MIYRDYGKTGIKISALGFGGMRFENPLDLEASVETVLYAFEKGITYFDTAPKYTKDKSEIILGEAVKEMKKSGKPFYISTKSSKVQAADLRRELEKSLKRLNLDTIDFYHSWCLLTLEGWENRKKGGAVREMLKAKEEGLVGHVCFSTHLSGADIRKVVEEGIFEGVTLGYSAINFPHREEGIAAASERDMGIVIMNPLGGGVIPSNPESFSFLKIRKEQNMVDSALHFLLSQKEITCALVGFRNKQDVDAAVKAVESFKPYTTQEIEGIKDKVRTDFNSLCTTCMYCQGCPVDIKVWSFMESANYFYLKGDNYPLDRIKFHWGVDISDLDRCTSCRLCEEKCTQKLPILKRFEDLKELYQEKQNAKLGRTPFD